MPDQPWWRPGPGRLVLALIFTACGSGLPSLARPQGVAAAADGRLSFTRWSDGALWTSAGGHVFLHRVEVRG
jgi:hypothetical protein